MYARSRDVITWCEDRMGDVEDVIRSILVSYKITCSKDILFYKLQSLSHHYMVSEDVDFERTLGR